MSDDFFEFPTDSSKAKVGIVVAYFRQYYKIMLGTAKKYNFAPKIAFVDLYAGKGCYDDGTPSTPIEILNTAVADSELSRSLHTMFNDKDKQTAIQLERNITSIEGINSLKHAPIITCAEVDDSLYEKVKKDFKMPTLLFLDPFGYAGISMGLIRAVLQEFGGDVIFFFNYNRVNAAITNPKAQPHIDALFGADRAGRLREFLKKWCSEKDSALRVARREAVVMSSLTSALKENYAEYVQTFCFKSATRTGTSHYLVFASKSDKGYELIQNVMAANSSWETDGVPSFIFLPPSANYQIPLDFSAPLLRLKREVQKMLVGRSKKMKEIWLEHSPGRNYIKANYKSVLCKLLDEKKIAVNRAPARRNTFADDIEASGRILFRCPVCHECSVFECACTSCGEKFTDDPRVLVNESKAPEFFDYISNSFEDGCCNDYIAELGILADHMRHPEYYICLVCNQFERTISDFRN